MTKVDVEIETIENGYLLTINGKKFSHRNPRELMKFLMVTLGEKEEED